jgi:hypothetical protein
MDDEVSTRKAKFYIRKQEAIGELNPEVYMMGSSVMFVTGGESRDEMTRIGDNERLPSGITAGRRACGDKATRGQARKGAC